MMSIPDIDASTAIFLDIDGTLLEFAALPDLVQVPQILPGLLAELSEALGGALALISGRTIASIDHLLQPATFPASGQHGAEWRPHAAAALIAPPVPPGLAIIRQRLRDLQQQRSDIFLECKTYSVAVHYAGAPGDLPQRLAGVIADLAADDWHILSAHQTYEIKLGHTDKGLAIRRFLAIAPFQGRYPIYFGDDLTDEDGFAAVQEAGGFAVRVGPPTQRRSLANAHLPCPQAARYWLAAQLQRLRTALAS